MDPLQMESDFVMGSDEEAYRKFIVYEEFDDNKENLPQEEQSEKQNYPLKQPNTKKDQFEKIIKFADVYNENTTGKTTLNELWEKLTVDLNEMGPPVRTSMQWRRVWSVYKYNEKRSEHRAHDISSQALSVSSQRLTRKRGNRRSSSKGRCSGYRTSIRKKSRTETCSLESNSLQEMRSDERMLIELRLLVQQQGQIIQNQGSIMMKMDKSNEMLAAIVQSHILDPMPQLAIQSDK